MAAGRNLYGLSTDLMGHAMKLNSLRDLYITELKDLYDAENRILKALPKMADAANSPDLRSAFEEHLEQSRGHVSRLEQVFQKLNETPKGEKCKGIAGIIDEGEDMMDEDAAPAVADAALIASAQRVEHYEIAAYGTVRTYARRLGLAEQEQLLNQTLQEEGAADKKLTILAESYINESAKTAR
jgi:ferritin-like metal-binding protein YciE